MQQTSGCFSDHIYLKISLMSLKKQKPCEIIFVKAWISQLVLMTEVTQLCTCTEGVVFQSQKDYSFLEKARLTVR